MKLSVVYPTKFNNRCEIETIIVKTDIMCKKFITILMLKQLILVKSNEIFVLQTAGKGTSCMCMADSTSMQAQQQCVSQHSLFLGHTQYI